jgi:hypothetical protein
MHDDKNVEESWKVHGRKEQLHVYKSQVEAMKKSHWKNNKIIYH